MYFFNPPCFIADFALNCCIDQVYDLLTKLKKIKINTTTMKPVEWRILLLVLVPPQGSGDDRIVILDCLS